MKKYGNAIEAKKKKQAEARLIEMEQPSTAEDEDEVDDEETGGEWVT